MPRSTNVILTQRPLRAFVVAGDRTADLCAFLSDDLGCDTARPTDEAPLGQLLQAFDPELLVVDPADPQAEEATEVAASVRPNTAVMVIGEDAGDAFVAPDADRDTWARTIDSALRAAATRSAEAGAEAAG